MSLTPYGNQASSKLSQVRNLESWTAEVNQGHPYELFQARSPGNDYKEVAQADRR